MKVSKKEAAALELLRSTGVDVLEAALVAKMALEAGRGKPGRARRCVAAGAAALEQQEQTVTFERAVEEALEARKDRRARTLSDFRYVCKRLMQRNEGLAQRRVRGMSARDCAGYLKGAFSTPVQLRKARAVLSGVFSTALRRGWCAENPVARVEVPRVVEGRVEILSPGEMEQLLEAAGVYEGGVCLPAVGMMLYAGIRPHEVARLTWDAVDLVHGYIALQARHSKTGGARRVTIHPPLRRILEGAAAGGGGRICPACWERHWAALHRAAGWGSPARPWRQDVLRHTFASYQLGHFRSYSVLQYEVGHRDVSLLRTRYVDLQGVEEAAGFWV